MKKPVNNEVMILTCLAASIAVADRTANAARRVVWREVERFFLGFTLTASVALLEVFEETQR